MREEEKKRSSQGSSLKRFFKKRWVFPAIYIASAAIILTAVLWYQQSNNADTDKYDYSASDVPGRSASDEPAVEVNRSMENFVMPVTDPDSVVIQKQFYDYEGDAEDQEAALVFYDNTYHPNTGIDIAMENGETFEVVAALSGTVTKVEKDSLLGNVIVIEHDDEIATQYQSITDIGIEVGDKVEQGQALAKAGQSLFNKDAGVHVHFEIRKQNEPVNPLDYFNKPLSTLQEETSAEDSKASEEKGAADDSGAAEEGEPAKDSKPSDDTGSQEEETGAEDSQSGQDEGDSTKSDEGKSDKPTEDKEKQDDQNKEQSSKSSDA
ncbi:MULTISPECIES: M23 family metallopeptidase [Bacillus]|uniref:M23 family metallopeptidase n=1 Tax=Bacillus TaxID=1386 RepID=UPI000C7802BA|nr:MULTISPECIES: M23 family metallopeptidase [Bacillus]PLR85450.1 peptidase M23 [Bacillus sp. V33-4]RSK54262.1 M23 family peptidase [Bacillus canaveralius]